MDDVGERWRTAMDGVGKKPAPAESSKLREITGDELQQILAAHQTWLKTDKKEGQRANLGNADLQGAVLSFANLRGAGLWGANLQGASLVQANLQGANLRQANFVADEDSGLSGADLTHAIFRNADLSDAKLSDVTGLLADKLAGADLSNAKLPPDIAKFVGLAQVAEISRHARNNFLAILGGCVFSWLTIATTTDVALLINSTETALPIIGTKVPIAGFYWAAPPILLALFVYLHLYLQRMWLGLATLPAVFPEGHSLDRRAFPWLLTSMVNTHVPRLRAERPAFSQLMVYLSIIVAWLLVPATLGLFWLRYLPRHDWPWTSAQVFLLALSIALAVVFYRRARSTLRGHKAPGFAWRRTWKRAATYAFGGQFLIFAAVGFFISDGAIEGIPAGKRGVPTAAHREIVPQVFAFFNYSPFLELAEAEISTKPGTWTGLAELPPEELEKLGKTELEKARVELAQVKAASLASADLRYADATGAFLAKANLRGADFQGAILTNAKLQGAELSQANLQGANLTNTKLQGAELPRANLQRADLIGAHLQKASLARASLQGASLSRANLREADLRAANFNGASLSLANLEEASLAGANLQEAKLLGANLQGANLNANFQGTNLSHAKLQRAILTFATNLTREQLDEACGDEETKLPEYLADYKMKPCPEPEQDPAN